VFIFPTFSDGFGLTQLEAQAWKLPVIASKFCGEVVEDGLNGVVLPELSGGAISAVLRRILAQPAQLSEFARNSVSPEQFGLARIGERLLAGDLKSVSLATDGHINTDSEGLGWSKKFTSEVD